MTYDEFLSKRENLVDLDYYNRSVRGFNQQLRLMVKRAASDAFSEAYSNTKEKHKKVNSARKAANQVIMKYKNGCRP